APDALVGDDDLVRRASAPGAQRTSEAVLHQQRGVDALRERAHLRERLGQFLADREQRVAPRRALARVFEQARDGRAHREQALLGAVVEVALDAPALLDGRFLHAPARYRELEARGSAIGL